MLDQMGRQFARGVNQSVPQHEGRREHGHARSARVDHQVRLDRLAPRYADFHTGVRRILIEADGQYMPLARILVWLGIVQAHTPGLVVHFHHESGQKIIAQHAVVPAAD